MVTVATHDKAGESQALLRDRVRRLDPPDQLYVRHTLDTLQAGLLTRARAPRLRTFREFAESEIVIPDGPHAGRRFTCDRQPFTGHFFNALDSARWPFVVLTGPTQSGKTLLLIIMLLFHLFEIAETVIFGLPDLDMARDKWREDIRPVIARTRYRDLLPSRGSGSRDGTPRAIEFKNGATLRFMSGGGGDKVRAGFTARVLFVTETDGLDTRSPGSRETNKIGQLEGRTRAYGATRRHYFECTVSVEDGYTWHGYKQGTESKLALPCFWCGEFVVPTTTNEERNLVAGWQGADDIVTAREKSAFICPHCAKPWDQEQRGWMNHSAVVIHRGQTIERLTQRRRRGTMPRYKVHGPIPRTSTLGFRWSAVNNLFVTGGDVGADEWAGQQATDEDAAERKLRQQVWAIPHEPEVIEFSGLTPQKVDKRGGALKRGMIPAAGKWVTLGIDTHRRFCRWVLIAWEPDATSHIVDYGTFEVEFDAMGAARALTAALRTFRELIAVGWAQVGSNTLRGPDQVWVDAGFDEHTAPIYAWCVESNGLAGDRVFWPTKGYGAAQHRDKTYRAPRKKTQAVRFVGEHYHMTAIPSHGVYLVAIDADHWKGFLHERLGTRLLGDAGERARGSMTLFDAMPGEHLKFAKELCAEKPIQEFKAGIGHVIRWVRIGRQGNHYLDAAAIACCAGHFCGVRIVKAAGAPDTDG